MKNPKIIIEENNKIMLNCDNHHYCSYNAGVVPCYGLLCSVSGPDCVHTGHRSPARQPPLVLSPLNV